ncbi:MAG: zf-HC2 domain-containing protein [Ignavibacteriales bacterium]|nr:zf-HC2 domain-containing protein [Ignavibacteriales bacterium]
MMRHSRVQQNLYDYLRAELPETKRQKIHAHLQQCDKCMSELKEVQSALHHVRQHSLNPSTARPETYWQLFAGKVESRIEEQKQEAVRPSFGDFVFSVFGQRSQFAVGFASALGLVLVFFALWRISLTESQESGLADEAAQVEKGATQHASLEARTYDYLERSKVLLVGLVNFEPELLKSSKVNFTRQKEISKDLLRESRELSASLNDPSQLRLKRLIGDLEIILVQIANLESEFDSPGVDIVKGGVERRNILLKINLAEIQRAENSVPNPGRAF